MCNNALKNFPDGRFFVGDIIQEHYNKKYDIVMEAAVIELIHDWKKGTLNMLRSSKEWFIAHRLFFIDGETEVQQVKTYDNLPDIRILVGKAEFEKVLSQENFQIEYENVWHTSPYKMGIIVARRQK